MQRNKEPAVSRNNRNLWLMAFDLVREEAIFNSMTCKHWLLMYRCWKSAMHKVTSLSPVFPSQRTAFATGPLLVLSVHEKKKKKICPFLTSAEVTIITKCELSASLLLKKIIPGSFTWRTCLKVEWTGSSLHKHYLYLKDFSALSKNISL